MELSLKSYQGCLVRRPNPPAHETILANYPVRRPNPPAHETTSAGYPVRRPRPPAHEATSAGYLVRRSGLPCSRGNLGRLSREQLGLSLRTGRLAGQLFSGRALTLGGKMVTEPRSCSS